MFILTDFLHWLSRYRFKFVVLLAAAVWGAVLVWPGPKLAMVFCTVGQGDAAVVSRGFTQVLIDAGPPNQAAADCLGRRLPFFDRRLEAVIISHPQTDHFGGLAEVLNRYRVDKFIYNGVAGDSRAWAQLSQLVEAEKSQVVTLAAGDKLKFAGAEIDVLWPEKMTVDNRKIEDGGRRSKVEGRKSIVDSNVLGVSSSRELNADALVLRLAYGSFSALFTGDIGEREEKKIINGYNGHNGYNGYNSFNHFNHSNHSSHSVSVLKVPHHGSKTSSSAEFLAALRPALAVIEVGKNSYGHPADEVIKRLQAVGAKVFRTDRDGDVVVVTDGKSWRLEK